MLKIITVIALTIAVTSTASAGVGSITESSITILKDKVYFDHSNTLYCGCSISFTKDKNSFDVVNLDNCQIKLQDEYLDNADHLVWENIVPPKFVSASTATHNKKQELMRDLHNIAPVENQIYKYRNKAQHGIVFHAPNIWGESCLVKDSNGTHETEVNNFLEPANCTKGDIARVWLYATERYGLSVDELSLANFHRWAKLDPVGSWEKLKHDRIAKIQGNANPFVEGVEPDASGNCAWEQ